MEAMPTRRAMKRRGIWVFMDYLMQCFAGFGKYESGC
jgi:hypothetical protein